MFQLADTINSKKNYPPPLVRRLDPLKLALTPVIVKSFAYAQQREGGREGVLQFAVLGDNWQVKNIQNLRMSQQKFPDETVHSIKQILMYLFLQK